VSDISVRQQNNELIIEGKLTQSTVMEALAQCKALLPQAGNIVMNLSAISHCDSTSLAFLTAMIREGKQRNVQVKISHMPKQMQELSKVSGLGSVFTQIE